MSIHSTARQDDKARENHEAMTSTPPLPDAPERHKPTPQGADNASRAYTKLLRAIAEAQAVLGGRRITVSLDEYGELMQYGKLHRELRTLIARATLVNLNYCYSRADMYVQIHPSQAKTVGNLRLALDDLINDTPNAPSRAFVFCWGE